MSFFADSQEVEYLHPLTHMFILLTVCFCISQKKTYNSKLLFDMHAL